MEDKIRRRKWWGGLEGGSGGMEARWAWKYPEMSCSYTFELGCRQVSAETAVKLPKCLISMGMSQNQSLTQSSEFQTPIGLRTLHLDAILYLRKIRKEVLFKIKPTRDCKRGSMMNFKMYSEYFSDYT